MKRLVALAVGLMSTQILATEMLWEDPKCGDLMGRHLDRHVEMPHGEGFVLSDVAKMTGSLYRMGVAPAQLSFFRTQWDLFLEANLGEPEITQVQTMIREARRNPGAYPRLVVCSLSSGCSLKTRGASQYIFSESNLVPRVVHSASVEEREKRNARIRANEYPEILPAMDPVLLLAPPSDASQSAVIAAVGELTRSFAQFAKSRVLVNWIAANFSRVRRGVSPDPIFDEFVWVDERRLYIHPGLVALLMNGSGTYVRYLFEKRYLEFQNTEQWEQSRRQSPLDVIVKMTKVDETLEAFAARLTRTLPDPSRVSLSVADVFTAATNLGRAMQATVDEENN